MKKNFPNEIVQLLNEFNKIQEDTLLDKISVFCEENDIDPKELGDTLSENEQFKRLLWFDCVRNNQLQDKTLKTQWQKQTLLDDW